MPNAEKVFSSSAAYNDIVLQSGRMAPHHHIYDSNAHGLFHHMRYSNTARLSIGSAQDWDIHPDFDERVYELEHLVVTGKERVNLAIEDGDEHFSRALGHMTQVNPFRTLRKM